MTTDTLEQDDLFATPPPDRGPPLLVRVVCAVCGKPCQISILASGKLCDLCRRNLTATTAHIAEVFGLAEDRRNMAGERYEAAWAQADDRVHDQLDRILAQRDDPNFTARLKRAQQLADWAGVLALWELRCAFDRAAIDLDRVRGWADVAMEEVEAARD